MIIQPRVLKGFRDFLPEQAEKRIRTMHILEKVFTSYGFVPIDTPVLEYKEVLLGKGGGETDKQVYAFADQGGRDVAMRFDLTVPFARFMAAHLNEVTLPFKRYHIDKVWRGENTQRGRYREFVQCDFDIVGIDAPAADLEILLIMKDAFRALGIQDLSFRVNHRGIFNQFLNNLGVLDLSAELLRTVDKLGKIGKDAVSALLEQLIGKERGDSLLEYIHGEDDFLATLDKLEYLSGGASEDSQRMRGIYNALKELGVDHQFVLDPSITRGLDYYTGIVYETFLDQLPQIGSVCSGGRYNNLASLYTKQELPGVGSSIGLDRLMAALEELGIQGSNQTGVDVVIFNLDEMMVPYYHHLAHSFREKGLSCEVSLQSQKLGKQFSWAEKRGAGFAIICGDDEKAQEKVTIKNLRTRENRQLIELADAISWVQDSITDSGMSY